MSKFKGVYFDKERGWCAQLDLEGRRMVRRGFGTELEAVEARKLLVAKPTLKGRALKEAIAEVLAERGIDPAQDPDRWLSQKERNKLAGAGYGSGERPSRKQVSAPKRSPVGPDAPGYMSLREAKKAGVAR